MQCNLFDQCVPAVPAPVGSQEIWLFDIVVRTSVEGFMRYKSEVAESYEDSKDLRDWCAISL